MPRRDTHHDVVKRSLIKDGWTITHDPFPLHIGKKRLFADLGAKYLLSAEREERKIAVEIKSFAGSSDIRDLEQAVGQYTIYQKILDQIEPDRALYLAVSEEVFQDTFTIEIGQLVLKEETVRLLVFHMEREEVVQWIPA